MKSKNGLKFSFLIFFMYLFINLTSCSTFNASLESLLVSPKVDNILVEGTWRLSNFYYMYNKNTGVTPKLPLDSYLFLSNSYLRINDLFFEYEDFKVKTSMLSDYMRIKFKIDDFSFLSLDDKKVNIFTIQDKDKNIYEFIRYDEDTLLFYYDDDIMYLFKKVSNKIDKNLEEHVKNNYKNNEFTDQKLEIIDTGLLLSFRGERQIVDSSIPKSMYNTVWFYQKGDGTYSHKVFDNIIIPKDRKLLTVRVESSEKNNLYEKIVIDDNNDAKDINVNSNEEFINQFIDINYINENYIGIDYDQNTEYLGNINTDKWAMLSIDEPYIEKRLNFSDIFDKNVDEFYSSYDKFLEFIKKDNLNMYDTPVREDSFRLERYGGDWFLKARINPKNQSDAFEPLDFDIEVLPNDKLVKDNNLSVNLGQIKLKYQDATDAFVSPNRDIIAILNNNTVGIYKIIDDKISNNAILEFSINNGDEVISAQWYTGNDAVEVNKLMEEFK